MLERIKKYFFPDIDSSLKKGIDKECINNIYYISFAMMVFMAMALILFFSSQKHFDREAWISAGSAAFCLTACLTAMVFSRRMRKNDQLAHGKVMLFKLVYVIVLSAWAIWASFRQYQRGEQLLTFYAVEMLIVWFVPFRPWIGAAVTVGIYGSLYAMLYAIDGAAGINTLNYLALAFISITGIIVRCHSQMRITVKSVLLQESNKTLEHLTRHDALTGLRNRKALDEDADALIGRPVSAFMIDIDYFKEINDVYGHKTGDDVLAETARQLRALFPESLCYRYGGDEFLVLSTRGDTYQEAAYRFTVASVPEKAILLSIGCAEGIPQDYQQLFEVISAADKRLYEAKRKAHSPEFGGHDRRRRA